MHLHSELVQINKPFAFVALTFISFWIWAISWHNILFLRAWNLMPLPVIPIQSRSVQFSNYRDEKIQRATLRRWKWEERNLSMAESAYGGDTLAGRFRQLHWNETGGRAQSELLPSLLICWIWFESWHGLGLPGALRKHPSPRWLTLQPDRGMRWRVCLLHLRLCLQFVFQTSPTQAHLFRVWKDSTEKETEHRGTVQGFVSNKPQQEDRSLFFLEEGGNYKKVCFYEDINWSEKEMGDGGGTQWRSRQYLMAEKRPL